MTNHLHPHWDAVDDGETPVPVRNAGDGHGAFPHQRTISRRPAAIAGILLVVAVGAGFVHGVENLTGQLSDRVDVTITSAGLDPFSITVQPGQEIVWKNAQDSAHQLVSDTLCHPPGSLDCMNTSLMFPGEEARYTIPLEIPDGSYTYVSITDPNVGGSIFVERFSQEEQAFPPPAGDAYTSPTAPPRRTSPPPPAQPDADEPAVDAQQIDEPEVIDQALLDTIQQQLALDTTVAGTRDDRTDLQASVAGIPTNPHTVGSVYGQTEGDELTFAGGTQQPFRQPETGAGVWGVVLLAVGVLLWLTRKAFAMTNTQ